MGALFILLANPDNIVHGLQEYVELIDKMIYHIKKQRDAAGINAFFASARDYRDSIPNNSSGVIRMHHELFVDIPDEAGALAKVTAFIAEAKISLKNIGVSHNREDEEGVLRLSFYDADARRNAQECWEAIEFITVKSRRIKYFNQTYYTRLKGILRIYERSTE